MGAESRPAEPAKTSKSTSTRSSKTEKSEKTEKAPEKPAAESKGTTTSTKESSSKKSSERTSDKPVEKEKAAGGKTDPPVDKLKAPPAASATRAGRKDPRGDGLPEEILTQIAQAKFEAQEEKLRDVSRFGIALIRDLPKLSGGECAKRVSEVQKALLKYEMQHVRAWEYQERRRRVEISNFEEEAERCRVEAATAGEMVPGLRAELEKERRRRKRYEGYEKAAEEVNKKRTRTEYKEAISSTTQEILQLKQKCQEYDSLVEERNKRAHLLRSAVSELAADLRREEELTNKVLEGKEAPSTEAPRPAGGDPIEVVL